MYIDPESVVYKAREVVDMQFVGYKTVPRPQLLLMRILGGLSANSPMITLLSISRKSRSAPILKSSVVQTL